MLKKIILLVTLVCILSSGLCVAENIFDVAQYTTPFGFTLDEFNASFEFIYNLTGEGNISLSSPVPVADGFSCVTCTSDALNPVYILIDSNQIVYGLASEYSVEIGKDVDYSQIYSTSVQFGSTIGQIMIAPFVADYGSIDDAFANEFNNFYEELQPAIAAITEHLSNTSDLLTGFVEHIPLRNNVCTLRGNTDINILTSSGSFNMTCIYAPVAINF